MFSNCYISAATILFLLQLFDLQLWITVEIHFEKVYLQEQGLLELQPGEKKRGSLQNYLNLLAQKPACEQSLSAIKNRVTSRPVTSFVRTMSIFV